MKAFIHRHQPAISLQGAVKAGLGGVLAIAFVALLGEASGSVWLMAPFGATCVLLFSVPASPLSQPMNVVGGHVFSTLVGVAAVTLLPVEWWSLGLAVGIAIAGMAALRITHPPAGADPLVVMAMGAGLDFVIFPTLLGSLALVLIASVFHRIPPRTTYPLELKGG